MSLLRNNAPITPKFSEVKVILADSCDMFRSLIRAWFNLDGKVQLVADTSSIESLPELLVSHDAELVIMDPVTFKTPGGACEIARRIGDEHPSVRLVALYSNCRPFVVDRMQRAGFHACICKQANSLATLRQAIESVSDGNAYFCAQTCRIQNAIYNDPGSFARILSGREQEILCFVGEGLDNEEIGKRLKLSPATVQTHRRNLFRKLGIHDTPSLMRYALEQGFWQPACRVPGL
jgi:DNA-binding NarL/FixJ family response regulator